MKVAITLVFDNKAFELAKYSLISAMLYGESGYHYCIFTHDFDVPADDPIFAIAGELGVTLKCRRIQQRRDVHGDRDARVTPASLLKIDAIDVLSKDYDRILYIDTDVLILDRLGLEGLAFDGHPIAAAYDMAEVIGMYDVAGMEPKRLEEARHYFNSGVIFVDASEWSADFVERFYRNASAHSQSCGYRVNCTSVDQCAWNMTFDRNWKRLPLTFNFQAFGIFSDEWRLAKVRHYVGRQKFVPVRWHRNDDRDVALINRIRRMLGHAPFANPFGGIVRRLNTIRKAEFTRKATASMRRIDDLLAAPMDR
jgi:lipopolysaccharide biosynthesis glycosyltransferase